MRLEEVAATSAAVAAVSGRLAKIERLADLLRRLSPDEIAIGVSFLSGALRQGRLGLGWRLIASARAVDPSPSSSIEIVEVDRVFSRIAEAGGGGSTVEKTAALRALLGRATADEQSFLVRLLTGELRQGALEGVLVEAVAKAAGVAAERVRRAAMMAGDSRERRARSPDAGRRRSGGLRCRAVPARAADAGGHGRRRRGRAQPHRGARARAQARWRASPGAQGRRRGAGLLATVEGSHVGGARSGRGRAPHAVTHADPRRRGHRAPPGPDAAAVPGDDAAVRTTARRRSAAWRAAAHPVLLRPVVSRRPLHHRRAAGGSVRVARGPGG